MIQHIGKNNTAESQCCQTVKSEEMYCSYLSKRAHLALYLIVITGLRKFLALHGGLIVINHATLVNVVSSVKVVTLVNR